MSQEKPQVTGRINTSCDRRSIISLTEGFFPLKERIFLATGNSFPVTGIKECLVSQYIFPVNERQFLVTGRTKITLRNMKNISQHRRYTSCVRLNRLYSCHRNSDTACDNKISSCQRNFPLTARKTDCIEILVTLYLMEFVKNSWEGVKKKGNF